MALLEPVRVAILILGILIASSNVHGASKGAVDTAAAQSQPSGQGNSSPTSPLAASETRPGEGREAQPGGQPQNQPREGPQVQPATSPQGQPLAPPSGQPQRRRGSSPRAGRRRTRPSAGPRAQPQSQPQLPSQFQFPGHGRRRGCFELTLLGLQGIHPGHLGAFPSGRKLQRSGVEGSRVWSWLGRNQGRGLWGGTIGSDFWLSPLRAYLWGPWRVLRTGAWVTRNGQRLWIPLPLYGFGRTVDLSNSVNIDDRLTSGIETGFSRRARNGRWGEGAPGGDSWSPSGGFGQGGRLGAPGRLDLGSLLGQRGPWGQHMGFGQGDNFGQWGSLNQGGGLGQGGPWGQPWGSSQRGGLTQGSRGRQGGRWSLGGLWGPNGGPSGFGVSFGQGSVWSQGGGGLGQGGLGLGQEGGLGLGGGWGQGNPWGQSGGLSGGFTGGLGQGSRWSQAGDGLGQGGLGVSRGGGLGLGVGWGQRNPWGQSGGLSSGFGQGSRWSQGGGGLGQGGLGLDQGDVMGLGSGWGQGRSWGQSGGFGQDGDFGQGSRWSLRGRRWSQGGSGLSLGQPGGSRVGGLLSPGGGTWGQGSTRIGFGQRSGPGQAGGWSLGGTLGQTDGFGQESGFGLGSRGQGISGAAGEGIGSVFGVGLVGRNISPFSRLQQRGSRSPGSRSGLGRIGGYGESSLSASRFGGEFSFGSQGSGRLARLLRRSSRRNPFSIWVLGGGSGSSQLGRRPGALGGRLSYASSWGSGTGRNAPSRSIWAMSQSSFSSPRFGSPYGGWYIWSQSSPRAGSMLTRLSTDPSFQLRFGNGQSSFGGSNQGGQRRIRE